MAANYDYDVMISYAWSNQETAFEIRDHLRRRGLRVWIDKERMHGNINDRMKEAVDKSRCVLICMSEKYEKSTNCKLVSRIKPFYCFVSGNEKIKDKTF
jgi:hypothetical protein